MIKRITTYAARNWIYIIDAIGVFAATITVRSSLQGISGMRWWIAVIFSYAVWFSVLYESTIKLGLKRGYREKVIFLEIVIVWVAPLFAGYIFVEYIVLAAR